MNLKAAQKIAVETCYKLESHCEIIKIAGGVRRLNPEPHDIEIVVIPKKEIIYDMFNSTIGSDISAGFIETVNSLGKIIKGKPRGKMMQIELSNIMLDLFIPDDFDFFRQYAIRTGSADYAFKVIATGWKKIGWCGSDKGLRKITDCVEMKGPDGKSKWKCVNKDAELPPVWTSEQHFFDWIRVPFIHPSKRIV
jgi:DNA polymerase/3'-5' exonuclease PolX